MKFALIIFCLNVSLGLGVAQTPIAVVHKKGDISFNAILDGIPARLEEGDSLFYGVEYVPDRRGEGREYPCVKWLRKELLPGGAKCEKGDHNHVADGVYYSLENWSIPEGSIVEEKRVEAEIWKMLHVAGRHRGGGNLMIFPSNGGSIDTGSAIVFKWKKCPAGKKVALEIFDSEGNPVWRSSVDGDIRGFESLDAAEAVKISAEKGVDRFYLSCTVEGSWEDPEYNECFPLTKESAEVLRNNLERSEKQDRGWSLVSRASAYYDQRQMAKAVEMLEAALKEDGLVGRMEIARTLRRIYEDLGDKESAARVGLAFLNE